MLYWFLVLTFAYADAETIQQPTTNSQDPHNWLVVHYRQTLEQFGIRGDTVGANEFLNSRIANASIDQEVLRSIKRLSSPKFQEREVAEQALIAIGTPALGLLVQAQTDGDTETRYRARRCVQAINQHHDAILIAAVGILKLNPTPTPSAVERLATVIRLLQDGHFSEAVNRALEQVPRALADETTKKIIADGTKDNNRSVSIACINALPKCMNEKELRQFLELLDHQDQQVALAAIKSIGFANPTQSKQRLLQLLDSTSSAIRGQAISCLRIVSGENFEYRYDGPETSRRVAIERWQAWSKHNPVFAERFRLLFRNFHAKPNGILVSVSNSKAQHYNLKGKLLWEQDVALYDAQYVNQNQIVICERTRNRVRLIDRNGKTQRAIDIKAPSDAQLLENGHLLVASGMGFVGEFDSSGAQVRLFEGLATPFDVDRLQNGNTLVADSGNNRLVEFDSAGRVVWTKEGLEFPNNVFRLNDGRTLYTTYNSGKVVMLNASGQIVWEKQLPGSTLFSVYSGDAMIYVADGSNRKIWELNMFGEVDGELQLPVPFCDVHFITK